MRYLDAAQLEPENELILTRLPNELSTRSEITHYVEEAKSAMELQGAYEKVQVIERENERVNLGGTWFASRVLRINLEKAEEVFPYVITCGNEFEKWYSKQSFLKKYYLDTVSGAVVSVAQEKLMRLIEAQHNIPQTSRISPGSLPDWPIEQQRLLFHLLGKEEIEKELGLRLTDSCLMLPSKSVSGLIFPAEHDFESCQLCPREDCEGRKAPFDPEKAKYYREYPL